MQKIILIICLGTISLVGCGDKEDTSQEPIHPKEIMLAARHSIKNYGSRKTVPTSRKNYGSRNKTPQKPFVAKKSVDTRSNPNNKTTFSSYH